VVFHAIPIPPTREKPHSPLGTQRTQLSLLPCSVWLAPKNIEILMSMGAVLPKTLLLFGTPDDRILRTI
jgi:hypothetical protein